MSNSTALIGACKDTPWLQVYCTVVVSTPAIIGIYEATKNHLIVHVPPNTISSRSGASIGQVATNPSEIPKINWDANFSYMSNNYFLGNIPCCSTLISKKKNSTSEERDCRGIKRPRPSGRRGPGRGVRGGRDSHVSQDGAGCGSYKDKYIADLNKQLVDQSSCSINNVNARKKVKVDVSAEFPQANKKKKKWLPPPPSFRNRKLEEVFYRK